MEIDGRKFPFESHAKPPVEALVVIFDLGGFSKFFSQPDVQFYVPRFLNRVFECMTTIFGGGDAYWLPEKLRSAAPLAIPNHQKFLGDGALYLWKVGETLQPDQIMGLLNHLFDLKQRFSHVVDACSDAVPVVDLPQTIRFGVARGSVYELTRTGTDEKEYIGYCINLASRLQRYCKEIGFIASARVGYTREALGEYGYVRVVAKNLVGFPRELVIVDKTEYESLPKGARDELFDPAPQLLGPRRPTGAATGSG